ncbi:hypothetical protein OWM54_19720 [Myxococcus sp. MISCRS1]|jgi:hypothetical protein|uniref:hypothetical protein n=1 Tax=Myxococcus sp. MISCRS1 TaxID=2996786 RepID=UPI002270A100|nr:hypothetical protein [Myxococcus sp. MISCRS1]MCY0999367.1 hypothetical protein [Myxococcus sp. MISCRS1]
MTRKSIHRQRELFITELGERPKPPGTGKPGGPKPMTTMAVGEESKPPDSGPRD